MSCITAPPADDCWLVDEDEDESEPVPAPPPQQRVFMPAVALPRRSRSADDPDPVAGDYDLPARLVFGPLRAPCSDDWESDLDAGGDVDAQAELTLLPEASNGVTAGKADGTAPAVFRERKPRKNTEPRALRRGGATAQRVSQLRRWQAVAHAPADAATDTSGGCSDESASGDDDEGPGGGGAGVYAKGSHSMCVIVRPPVPPADTVHPVLDELAEMVQQHTLQPILPVLVDLPTPMPMPTPTPTPTSTPPRQPPAGAPGGGLVNEAGAS